MEVIYAGPKIERFIKDLSEPLGARVEKTIDLLVQYGNTLRLPHSKNVGRGLFELRVLGEIQIRILYTFRKNKAYLLHIFIKKTDRISPKDINYALRIKKLLV